MRMTPVPLQFAPRVVLAVRDWYRSTFSAPLLFAGAGAPKRPAMIQPDAPVTFWAEATKPPDGAWPFFGSAELVMQASPSGIYGFHGRVRLAEGSGPRLRRLTAPARCRVTVRARGYQPHVIESLSIPKADAETEATPLINLYPAPDYPFPPDLRRPTVFEATVRGPDGAGLADVVVKADTIDPAGPGHGQLVSSRTDAEGRLLQVLDYVDEREDQERIKAISALKLTLTNAAGTERVYEFPRIAASTRNRPETLVNGQLLLGGASLADALVALQLEGDPKPLPGTTRSRADGGWDLRADDRLTLAGSAGAALLITSKQGEQFKKDGKIINFARPNSLGSISLP